MATKLRVGVVFGGESGEHEVSLAGAASVMDAMDRERFEPVPIGITREGRWLVGGGPLRALAQEGAGRAPRGGPPGGGAWARGGRPAASARTGGRGQGAGGGRGGGVGQAGAGGARGPRRPR